jgi:hypothetical protein
MWIVGFATAQMLGAQNAIRKSGHAPSHVYPTYQLQHPTPLH